MGKSKRTERFNYIQKKKRNQSKAVTIRKLRRKKINNQYCITGE